MLIIDRFEGDLAVLEIDKKTVEIPTKYLPNSASEGDILKLIIDKKNTEKRKERIQNLADKLFE